MKNETRYIYYLKVARMLYQLVCQNTKPKSMGVSAAASAAFRVDSKVDSVTRYPA